MPRGIRSTPGRRGTRRDSPTISPDESGGPRAAADAASFAALPFASCFAYSPGGAGSLGEKGRCLCGRLKAADRRWLPRLIAQVWLEAARQGPPAAVLGAGVVLVPVPGSAPVPRGPWVAERLAWCLKEIGLAADVWPVLRRGRPVRKSAFAPSGERPSVIEHYASFAIDCASLGGAQIRRGAQVSDSRRIPRLTLVDDVITRGRTMLAAAARLREAFPDAEIRAFALLRTLGRDERLCRLLDPCGGEVRWVLGDARRTP